MRVCLHLQQRCAQVAELGGPRAQVAQQPRQNSEVAAAPPRGYGIKWANQEGNAAISVEVKLLY